MANFREWPDPLGPYPEPIERRPEHGNWEWTGRGWKNLDYVAKKPQHRAWCLYNSTYAHLNKCICREDKNYGK